MKRGFSRSAAIVISTLTATVAVVFFAGAGLSFYLEDYCRDAERITSPEQSGLTGGATWRFPAELRCTYQDGTSTAFTSWSPLVAILMTALVVALVAAAGWRLLLARPRST